MSITNYANNPENSKGRLFEESKSKNRNAFARDRDRIIHSNAFRRLEYKTQVFINHESDHYRTRLTHSLEVAQISRSIAAQLNLQIELAEALALAHDLGHAAFGHSGEDALNNVMKPYGGFDHNFHTIRILTEMENKYPNFKGINPSWEVIEGLAKHNGPISKEKINSKLQKLDKNYNLELHKFASLEAQVAALSDDIAYNNHDLDDGIKAKLFTISELEKFEFIRKILKKIRKQYPTISDYHLKHELIRTLIGAMINDLVKTTLKNIEEHHINTLEDVRNAKISIANFSPKMQENHKYLREFLMKKMYLNRKVKNVMSKAKVMLTELFHIYMEYPKHLPKNWQHKELLKNEITRANLIADFIAGMTDRYARSEFLRLFDVV